MPYQSGGSRNGQQMDNLKCAQDWNVISSGASNVGTNSGALELLRDRSPGNWEAFVEEPKRRSFSYVLRREASGLKDEELERWFQNLHPRKLGVSVGAWTDAA